jgi:organic radical activating enzyme
VRTLKYVEIMASYACTLSCAGCTNYSNFNYSGYPAWAPTRDQIAEWTALMHFEAFGIIGGEPLLNPEIRTWIYGIRALLPATTELSLVTNGTRLEHVPDLVRWMADNAPSKLTVVPHLGESVIAPQVRQMVEATGLSFEQSRDSYQDVDGTRQTQTRYRLADPAVLVEVFRPRFFVKSYQGFGADMRPWNHNNPKAAIEICPCRYCPLLYEGRLYKCSQIALLRDHLGRLGLLGADDWQPYLSYRGVSPADSAPELDRFVRRFGVPESICAMCPAEPAGEAWIDHGAEVSTRSDWLKRHGTQWPPRQLPIVGP